MEHDMKVVTKNCKISFCYKPSIIAYFTSIFIFRFGIKFLDGKRSNNNYFSKILLLKSQQTFFCVQHYYRFIQCFRFGQKRSCCILPTLTVDGAYSQLSGCNGDRFLQYFTKILIVRESNKNMTSFIEIITIASKIKFEWCTTGITCAMKNISNFIKLLNWKQCDLKRNLTQSQLINETKCIRSLFTFIYNQHLNTSSLSSKLELQNLYKLLEESFCLDQNV